MFIKSICTQFVFVLAITYKWISRRRKGLAFEVDKVVNTLNVRETIYNLSFSTKSVMKTVSEKLIELDNTEWYRELFNDRRMAKTKTNCVLSCSTHIVYHPLGPAAWSTCLSHRLAGERRTETGP
jgi:hypothetical protein